jgi:hypothetical protein
MYGLGQLEHWDRGFESQSKHRLMSQFFYALLSYVGRGLVIDLSPIQELLPKCLKGFTISEISSDLEQARGHNALKMHAR